MKYSKQKSSRMEFRLIPILIGIIAGLLPLIVRMHMDVLNPELKALYFKETHADLFSYVKAMFFIWSTVLVGIVFVYEVYTKKLKLKRNVLITGLMSSFLFLIWLSFLMSPHKATSLMGIVDRYEGTWVWSAYIIIAYITYQAIQSIEDIHTIFKGLCLGGFFVFLLGFFQWIGLDYMSFPITKYLIVPPQYWNSVKELSITISNMIYSTLYNPNFVASYAVLCLPIGVYMSLVSIKTKKGYFYISFVFLGVVSLLGCLSSSGYLATAVMIIFATVILFISMKNFITAFVKLHYRATIILIITLFIFSIAAFNNVLFKNEVRDFLVSIKQLSKSVEYDVSIMKIENNEFKFKIYNTTLLGTLKESKFDLYINDALIEFIEQGHQNQFVAVNSPDVKISKIVNNERRQIILLINDRTIPLGFSDDKLTFIDLVGNPIYEENPEVFPYLYGKEKLGSARGLIWGRTIPLLKNTLFFGKGADTLAFYYPQNDFLGKFSVGWPFFMFVDKPHNMLLQLAFQFGMFALLIYIALIFCILFKTISTRSLSDSRKKKMELALGLAVLGYGVASFFNDSIVNVAPVYWIIIGCCLATISMKDEKL